MHTITHQPIDFARRLSLKNAATLALISLIVLISLGLNLKTAEAQETLLDLIPAETPYLLYYQPDEQMIKMMKKIPASEFSEEEILSETEPVKRMWGLLSRDLAYFLSGSTDRDLGLTAVNQLRLSVYGLGIWPVFTASVADPDRVKSWIITTAQSAGVSYEMQGELIRFKMSVSPAVPGSLALAFSGSKWVKIAFVPQAFDAEMIPYLTGAKSPRVSMRRARMFNSWTQKAHVKFNSAVWIGIERLTKTILGQGMGLNKKLGWIDDSIAKSLSPACTQEVIELFHHVPYLTFGAPSQNDSDLFRGRVVLKFSDQVARVLKTLSTEGVYLSPVDDALVNLTWSLNLRALIEAAQQLLQALIARPFKCEPIVNAGLTTQRLQAIAAKLMMVPPLVHRIKGLSFTAYDLDPKPRGMLIVSVDQISDVLTMLKSVNPQLSQLQLPAMGAGPQEVTGIPIPPQVELQAELRTHALGFSFGADTTPAVSELLKRPPSSNPPVLSFGYHLGHLIKMITSYLDKVHKTTRKLEEAKYQEQVELAKMKGEAPPPPPQYSDPSTSFDQFKMIEIGALQISFSFTDVGLTIDSSIDFLGSPQK